jgi:tripartite-type tricarboxylate transporter receptor subunit TctC
LFQCSASRGQALGRLSFGDCGICHQPSQNLEHSLCAFVLRLEHDVVGFSAGGPIDVIARIVAQDIRPDRRHAMVATAFVARADPDGYTVLFASLSHIVNFLLVLNVKYDPLKDFAPISNGALLPMLVVTRAEAPYNSIQDLIADAKAKPGELLYGSAGNGGSAHLAASMLERATGTRMRHVPFRGNAPALSEVIAGRITFMFYPVIGVADLVEGGG